MPGRQLMIATIIGVFITRLDSCLVVTTPYNVSNSEPRKGKTILSSLIESYMKKHPSMQTLILSKEWIHSDLLSFTVGTWESYEMKSYTGGSARTHNIMHIVLHSIFNTILNKIKQRLNYKNDLSWTEALHHLNDVTWTLCWLRCTDNNSL